MAQAVMTVTVDGVAHEADLNRLTFAEARAIERITGESFADIMRTQSMTAVQALVWVILKRDDPTLKFTDLDDRAINDFDLATSKDEPDPTPATAA